MNQAGQSPYDLYAVECRMLSEFLVVCTDHKSTAEMLPAERATRLAVDSEVYRNSTDKNDQVTIQYNHHRVVVHPCRSRPVHPKAEDTLP